MNLKTFRASSMAECLTEVKKDLGGDAVILRTRSYRVGGVLGVGGRQMVEITASNEAPDRAPRARRAPRPSRTPRTQPNAAPVSVPASVPASGPAPASAPSGVSEATAGTATATMPAVTVPDRAARAEPSGDPFEALAAGRPATRGVKGGASVPELQGAVVDPLPELATRVSVNPQRQAAIDALQDELGAIKRMVSQVLCASRASASDNVVGAVVESGGMSEPIFDVFRALSDQRLDPGHVDRVVAAAREELNAVELADASVARACVARHLAGLIATDRGLSREDASSRSGAAVIALMGPTGVGKTTTIAKLAATLKLRHRQRVGLLTCDTYRIAAVDQLRVYANIIGLPLSVANTPAEATRHLDAMRECDVVLVDTAGRSPSDDHRLEELRAMLDAIRPDQSHLVLSAASADDVLNRAAERFGQLNPTRLLFTKLDEAVSLGPVMNAAIALQRPVSFVTTGQEVPDHFEDANGERLGRALLDGGRFASGKDRAA